MNTIKKTDQFEVTVDKNWKRFRSVDYNYDFNLKNGIFMRWGKTEKDDPVYASFGPEIADIEISTKCNGVSGKLCQYCYKANTPDGKNMSFETFKSLICNVNSNSQLTQVAFGLGSTGWENPDLWKMCQFLRESHVIPNGTLADVDDAMAVKIAEWFGACSISYHSDWNVMCNSVERLIKAKALFSESRIKQINIHFMICEETYDECLHLFDLVKTDIRLKGLNAIVLLGLKKCGRADTDKFHRLSDDKFQNLVELAKEKNIGLGFDSCQAGKVVHVYQKLWGNDKKIMNQINLLAEPCESFGMFSSYFDVDGKYAPCSFCPGSSKFKTKWTEVDGTEGDFIRFWKYGKKLAELRQRSLDKNRECLYYEV